MPSQTYSEVFKVTEKECISALDDTLPHLVGTYILVQWMEITSAKLINTHLTDQQLSVGEKISIEHTAMVKKGEEVQITATLQEKEKRRVHFSLEAFAQDRLIASASHERIILSKKIIQRMVNNDS